MTETNAAEAPSLEAARSFRHPMIEFGEAVVAALSWPHQPLPQSMTDRLHKSVSGLKAFLNMDGEAFSTMVSNVLDGAVLTDPSAERLDRLEGFAQKLTDDLPPRLEQLEPLPARLTALEAKVEQLAAAPVAPVIAPAPGETVTEDLPAVAETPEIKPEGGRHKPHGAKSQADLNLDQA